MDLEVLRWIVLCCFGYLILVYGVSFVLLLASAAEHRHNAQLARVQNEIVSELKAGFEEHLEQTKGHVQRLAQIGESLDLALTGHKCKAMAGLIEEGADLISEDAEDTVRDAGLIGAAQRVEHYEIAAYGTARALANCLGYDEAADLLGETLEEEKATDEKLTDLAESAINAEAPQSSK